MKPRRVFLVGPPGAGKSTFARRWARSLGVPWIDTDAEIERRSGKDISALFAEGEDTFRQWEREVIQALLREESEGIWALGGGTLTQAELEERLHREGYLLWIDPPLDWVLHRLQHATRVRPLLQGCSIADWKALIERRRPLYRRADLHWDPSRIPEPFVRAWVARRLNLPADIPFANREGSVSEAGTAAASNSAPPPPQKTHNAAPPPLPI